jgi:hypothetical protein
MCSFASRLSSFQTALLPLLCEMEPFFLSIPWPLCLLMIDGLGRSNTKRTHKVLGPHQQIPFTDTTPLPQIPGFWRITRMDDCEVVGRRLAVPTPRKIPGAPLTAEPLQLFPARRDLSERLPEYNSVPFDGLLQLSCASTPSTGTCSFEICPYSAHSRCPRKRRAHYRRRALRSFSLKTKI